MDILLHADVFFYKIFQPDIHAEGNRPFEQTREFLHIQAAQVDVVEVPAEALVIGCIKVLLFGKMLLQIFPHLAGGHGALPGPVIPRNHAALMPEEQTANFIGGGVHVKDHADALLLLRGALLHFQHDGRGKVPISPIGNLVIFTDVDHAPQVLDQASVGVIRRRLVKEAPAIGIGVQDDLHGVDDRGLAAAGMSGEKVDALVEA